MRKRERTKRVKARRRDRAHPVYWFIGPVTAEEQATVRAYLSTSQLPSEVAVSSSRIPCFRIKRSLVSQEQLMTEFPGVAVTPNDHFHFLHRQWADLQTAANG